MVDPQVKAISERLRREESEFVDFSAIAERSKTYGMPTSVRTLRFYVNEGILPAPRKQGKTPVYPEREIIHLLLSIHLMKTRLGRSLAEIKTVLQNQREDAEVLADKCSYLYEHVLLSERFPRVQREWVVDAFFRSLSGQLTLYPKKRRDESGTRQAGEILITELVEDIEQLARWQTQPNGESEWVSPEEVLRGAGDRRVLEGIEMEPNQGQKTPDVTPLAPPEGAVTVEVARRREELFLERFERNLARISRVFHPMEKKYHSIRSDAMTPEVDDPYQDVVQVLKSHDLYDRKLLESLPHDRSSRYTLPPPGLFGKKKPRLVISAVVRSPIGDLARLGGVIDPLGSDVVRDVISAQNRDPNAYHVIGILSTVGWSREATARLPRGENFHVVLIEQTAGGGWELHHTLPEKLKDLQVVYDPEDLSEKVSRTFYKIIEDPELGIPGGHVQVSNLLEHLGVDEDVLKVALEQVKQENPRIELTEVSGRKILKRARY